MGSPLYMSPEQLNSSKDADARSDVWALGVILYELLTAESPFLAETMPGVMIKITASEPPSLRARRPEVSPALERVILTCLEKDRSKRFQSIGDLANALVDFGTPRSRLSLERIVGLMAASGMALSLPGTLSPIAAGALPPESAAPANTAGTMASWDRAASTSKRSRGTRYAGLAAGALALLVLALFALRSGEDPTDEASPATVASGPAAAATPEPIPSERQPAASAMPVVTSIAPVASPSATASAFATPAPLRATASASTALRGAAQPRAGTSRSAAAKNPGKPSPTGKVDVYDDRK
jgi:serine/threonine-protein kinase